MIRGNPSSTILPSPISARRITSIVTCASFTDLRTSGLTPALIRGVRSLGLFLLLFSDAIPRLSLGSPCVGSIDSFLKRSGTRTRTAVGRLLTAGRPWKCDKGETGGSERWEPKDCSEGEYRPGLRMCRERSEMGRPKEASSSASGGIVPGELDLIARGDSCVGLRGGTSLNDERRKCFKLDPPRWGGNKPGR